MTEVIQYPVNIRRRRHVEAFQEDFDDEESISQELRKKLFFIEMCRIQAIEGYPAEIDSYVEVNTSDELKNELLSMERCYMQDVVADIQEIASYEDVSTSQESDVSTDRRCMQVVEGSSEETASYLEVSTVQELGVSIDKRCREAIEGDPEEIASDVEVQAFEDPEETILCVVEKGTRQDMHTKFLSLDRRHMGGINEDHKEIGIMGHMPAVNRDPEELSSCLDKESTSQELKRKLLSIDIHRKLPVYCDSETVARSEEESIRQDMNMQLLSLDKRRMGEGSIHQELMNTQLLIGNRNTADIRKYSEEFMLYMDHLRKLQELNMGQLSRDNRFEGGLRETEMNVEEELLDLRIHKDQIKDSEDDPEKTALPLGEEEFEEEEEEYEQEDVEEDEEEGEEDKEDDSSLQKLKETKLSINSFRLESPDSYVYKITDREKLKMKMISQDTRFMDYIKECLRGQRMCVEEESEDIAPLDLRNRKHPPEVSEENPKNTVLGLEEEEEEEEESNTSQKLYGENDLAEGRPLDLTYQKHVIEASTEDPKNSVSGLGEKENTFEEMSTSGFSDDHEEMVLCVEKGATIKELKDRLALIDKYLVGAFSEDSEKMSSCKEEKEEDSVVQELNNKQLSTDSLHMRDCSENPEEIVSCLEGVENTAQNFKKHHRSTGEQEMEILEMKLKLLEDWELSKRLGFKQLMNETESVRMLQADIEYFEERLISKNIPINEEDFKIFYETQISPENLMKRTDSPIGLKPQTPKRHEQQTKKATSTPITKKAKAEIPEMSNNFEANEDGMVVIGPNGTTVTKTALEAINWSLSGPAATRKLLVDVFGRETLAFHTLTGKPSPAFMDCDKPMKNQLDPLKVADVIHLVMQRTQLTAKEVRNAITTKCADENKMFRKREKKKLNAASKQQKKAEN